MRTLLTSPRRPSLQAVPACGASHFVIRTLYFVLQHSFGTDSHMPRHAEAASQRQRMKQLKLAV